MIRYVIMNYIIVSTTFLSLFGLTGCSQNKTIVNLTNACEIEFEGYDEDGSVTHYECNPDYDYTNAEISNFISTIKYKLDKDSKLSNGDKITLTASYSQQTADHLNINVVEPTRAFKVKGLTPILKKYSDIDKDIRKEMTDSATKEITYKLNHFNYQYDFFGNEKETVTIHSIEKIGTYFSKRGSDADVDMIFKTNVTSELKGKSKDYIQCFHVSYINLRPENIENNVSNFSIFEYDINNNDTNEIILNSFLSLPESKRVGEDKW